VIAERYARFHISRTLLGCLVVHSCSRSTVQNKGAVVVNNRCYVHVFGGSYRQRTALLFKWDMFLQWLVNICADVCENACIR
jgi:hypothetical protein